MFLVPAASVLAALLLLSGDVSAQCLTGDDNPPTMNARSRVAVIESRFDFALDTLKRTVLIEARDNIFYSPHSLHQALTLAYFGARGTTEESLRKALHIPTDLSKVDLQRYYAFENSVKLENGQGNETADYDYTSANRLWISDTRKVRECMLSLFGDQLEKTDFRSNPAAVRERINEWVSNTTKGHIRDLLSADSITEDTDLVLANAVYFKAPWLSRFDPANTKKDLFYTSGSQHSTVMFMRQKGNFNHVISEELGAHVLELPYKGEQISMFILLPPFATARSTNDAVDKANNDRDGVRQLIERISTEAGSTELRDLLDAGIPAQQVEVIMPRFEVERELPLDTLLHAIGAGELLMPNAANLRGFIEDGERPLSLGSAVHRARIEVTEEGTTAAAATALYSFRSGRPLQPAVFDANHPFVYLIYEKPTRTVLFSGVYRTPSTAQNTAETTTA